MAALPDLQGENFLEQAAEADIADLFGDVGLEPGPAADLPEGVAPGVRAAACGDEIDVAVVETEAHGDVAKAGLKEREASGQGGGNGGQRSGGLGRKAEEEVDVAAAQGSAFGLGAGQGDGFEMVTGPGAQDGSIRRRMLGGEGSSAEER